MNNRNPLIYKGAGAGGIRIRLRISDTLVKAKRGPEKGPCYIWRLKMNSG